MTKLGAPKSKASPHDRFIKGMATYKEVLQDLPKVLPPEILKHLSLRSVQLQPGSYIDDRLAHAASDLLFSCRFRDKDGFLYFLFEHQTSPAWDMPLRTADYTVRILNDWRREHPKARRLPPVVPVVLYQSRRAWNFPRRLNELLDLEPGLRQELDHVLLSGGFFLIDLKAADL